MNLMPIPTRTFVFIGLIFVLAILFPYLIAYFKKASLGWVGVFSSAFMAFILLIVFGGLPRRSLSLDERGIFLKTTYYTNKVPFSKISSVQVGEECVVDFDFKRNGIGIPGLYSGWYVSNGLNYLVDFVNKPNICIYYNGSSEALALEVSNPSDLKGLIHD